MCPHAQMLREMSSRKIRCLLVHNHALLRRGLRRLLEDESDLDVVSEAGSAAECLRKVFEFRPDVVIADDRIFGLSASEVQLLVESESPHTKLVFLNLEERGNSTFGRLRSGMEHSTEQQNSVEELVQMVRNVCGIEASHSATGSTDNRLRPAGSPPPGDTLTGREREIVKLLAEGKTVRAAATALGLSSKTVDAHKFNLMRKLGIHNKAELVMWAIQKRIVKIPA